MAESEIGRDRLQRTKERLDFRSAQVGEEIIADADGGQPAANHEGKDMEVVVYWFPLGKNVFSQTVV